jgi:quinol monooxygenase YgiN
MLEPIRVEPGCTACRLWKGLEEGGEVVLVQEWQDESAFRKHIRGRTFRSLLMALDLLSQFPLISVTRGQNRRDLSDIRELYEFC